MLELKQSSLKKNEQIFMGQIRDLKQQNDTQVQELLAMTKKNQQMHVESAHLAASLSKEKLKANALATGNANEAFVQAQTDQNEMEVCLVVVSLADLENLTAKNKLLEEEIRLLKEKNRVRKGMLLASFARFFSLLESNRAMNAYGTSLKQMFFS